MMIDRVCPKCGGKAAPIVFPDERGRFAKLWECQKCKSCWGVPTYSYVARDLEHDWGLKPWTEPVPGERAGRTSVGVWIFGNNAGSRAASGKKSMAAIPESRRPAAIALLVIFGALALFLRHWL
jgi:hypothetical protein